MRKLSLMLLLCMVFIFGCSSGGESPLVPKIPSIEAENDAGSHYTWGFWQFTANPDDETLDIVQIREGNLHLNALHFLEPPSGLHLKLESPPQFSGGNLLIDVGVRHPFLGLAKYTGFDVRGILISNGSVSGYNDAAILIPGSGDTRILNPDGLTRWWNPTEFPSNDLQPIKGYIDGLLGAPDSIENYTATLNGYKYFTGGLEANEPLFNVDPAGRGVFAAGQKNVRHYEISLAGGLVFNYAVDASWAQPVGSPPFNIPDDFPENANCSEAWRLSIVETSNTLFNDGETSGGNLSLEIDVYDWFDASLNIVRVESPGNFPMTQSSIAIGGGEGYSTYAIEIAGATPGLDAIDLLISVISEKADFGGYISGTNTTAYFTHTSDVGSGVPGSEFIYGIADYGFLDPYPDNPNNILLFENMLNLPLVGLFADNDIVKYYKGHSGGYFSNPDAYETAALNLGYEFVVSNEVPIDLDGVKMVVLMQLFSSLSQDGYFTESEVDDIRDFINGGGVCVLLMDNTGATDGAIGNKLLNDIGADFTYPEDLNVEDPYDDISVDPITEGIDILYANVGGRFNLGPTAISIVRGYDDDNIELCTVICKSPIGG